VAVMTITLTKYGWCGTIKGCIKNIPFEFYANGDNAQYVQQQLIFEVGKLRAYARVAS